MISFRVEGQEIDVRRNINISISYDNPIFGFDNIKLSRTQSFQIPKTRRNNRVFGYSYRPDMYGSQMRQYYDAIMYHGGGQIEGRLYISNADRLNYNAVFVFGELVALKDVSDAGDITNYLDTDEVILWDNTVLPSLAADFEPLSLRIYDVPLVNRNVRNGWNYMPTTSIKYLLDRSLSIFNIDIDYTVIADQIGKLGIKLNKVNGNNTPDVISALQRAYDPVSDTESYLIPGLIDYFEAVSIQTPSDPNTEYLVLRAKTTFMCRLQTPWPNTRFILFKQIRNNAVIKQWQAAHLTIITWLVFNEGDILSAEYTNVDNSITNASEKYREVSFASVPLQIFISPPETLEYPGSYSLYPNLPEVSVIDLLKTVSSITATAIIYTDNTISFFDYTFPDGGIDITEKLLSVDRISRTIGNYGYNNIIDFASSEKIQDTKRIEHNYYIDNDSLNRLNTLYTIPFSEGDWINSVSGYQRPAIYDIIEGDDNGEITFQYGQDKDTIVTMNPASRQNLARISFVSNPNFQNIFTQSTTVECKIKMYLFEFNQIQHDTVYILHNNRYVIFSAKWQKNIASLVLIKIE